ncbi:endonuclease/exonuclease/phosphatase family protein [Streptomyces sp. NPDC054796]
MLTGEEEHHDRRGAERGTSARRPPRPTAEPAHAPEGPDPHRDANGDGDGGPNGDRDRVPEGPHPDAERAKVRRARLRRPLAWFATLLLTALSVLLAIRASDGDGPTPVPQLLAFLPWFLAPGWLALLCAILARRVLLSLWAVIVLVATGWFTLPYGPDAPAASGESPAKARFRVLSANLQFGGATEPLLDTVLTEHPQFVSVQECDTRCADALRTEEVRKAYPYRVIVPGRTSEGSALLSVYPLRGESSVDSRMAMPGAVADVHGRSVRFQVAHPMPPKPDSMVSWREELGRLREYAEAHADEPTIVAGDFNASQDHAAFRDLLDTGLQDAARQTGLSRTPTWPRPAAPPLGAQIDHILLGERLVATETRFLDFPGTDHRALIADVKLY